MRETIRDYGGMIVGYLDHESNGDIVARGYNGLILGRYEKSSDTTKNYAGRIIWRGNMAAALLVVRVNQRFFIKITNFHMYTYTLYFCVL